MERFVELFYRTDCGTQRQPAARLSASDPASDVADATAPDAGGGAEAGKSGQAITGAAGGTTNSVEQCLPSAVLWPTGSRGKYASPHRLASAAKELVLSTGKCLCPPSQRKRLPLSEVLRKLQAGRNLARKLRRAKPSETKVAFSAWLSAVRCEELEGDYSFVDLISSSSISYTNQLFTVSVVLTWSKVPVRPVTTGGGRGVMEAQVRGGARTPREQFEGRNTSQDGRYFIFQERARPRLFVAWPCLLTCDCLLFCVLGAGSHA